MTGWARRGWGLARDLEDLTARDIYTAIAHKSLFAIGPADDNLTCPVESAVNRILDEAMAAAEATRLRSLEEVRLSEISKNIKVPMGGKGQGLRCACSNARCPLLAAASNNRQDCAGCGIC